MRDFSFHSPTKLIFGQGKADVLADELKASGIGRVLLLTGSRSVFSSGLYDKITGQLTAAGIHWETVSGVQPNPKLGKVREAILAGQKMQAEAIVPVGGGSVFDAAKAVAVGIPAEKDIWVIISRKLPVDKAVPIYGVLTLSGTSSEINSGFVITNEETHEKLYLATPHTSPKVAIVDPALQFSVPRKQVLSAGFDALTHILEAYFGGFDTSPVIVEGCESMARSIIRCLRALAADEDKLQDYAVRSELAFCSVYAHSGWASVGKGVRGDFSSHPIAHAVGSLYDVPHGISLGVVMPAWMRFVYEQGLCQEIFTRLATHVFELTDADSNDLGYAGAYALSELIKEMGLPASLGDLKIERDDIPRIAELASRTLPFGCAMEMDLERITKVLEHAC
ncbi:iron-containing alcohol dehydrogenase [Desulfovibrio sp. OttesenSCG-928-C06]|nr:iron-containing alcohol dehydrogenase [Desulfovibrio sp. OttesenSCG-928-C06]